MDFASSPFTDMFYSLGISMVPREAVIGLNGWLFLGDRFENIISDGRWGSSEKAIANVARIGDASKAWDNWLSQNGVKLYRVMVAPNKESIYPELMPFWARPLPPTATDALMAGTDSKIYVDLRDALKQAKATQTEALYFKTDTHWNSLGAGIAFRAFAKEVAGALPELLWPADDAFHLIGMGSQQETDLVRILRLKKDVPNPSPILGIQQVPVETTQYELETKKVIRTGGNPEVNTIPVMVRSRDALNAKRVLWLRDSFGTALSPFMAATFHEVIQVHVSDAFKSERRFAELVKAWSPDYVFITVVERSARLRLFAKPPP
jgi:hypothetical protein